MFGWIVFLLTGRTDFSATGDTPLASCDAMMAMIQENLGGPYWKTKPDDLIRRSLDAKIWLKKDQ